MSSVPGWVWPNSVLFAGGVVYLWWRLVAQTTGRGTTMRRIGTAVAVFIAVAAPLALLSQFLMPMGFQRVIGWPAWISYAFVIFAGCTALLLEPLRVALWWWRRRRSRPAAEVVRASDLVEARERDDDLVMAPGQAGSGQVVADHPGGGTPPVAPPAGPAVVSRRVAVQRALAVGIVAVGATLTGVALAGALGQPRVRRQTIAIRALPDEAVGTRIALISDLHVGALTRRADCQRIVDLVNAQNPDIVCLAGDFSDGDVTDLGEELAPLADLRSTAGTFFVTGNHEFYFDLDNWLQYFPTIGVRVLANESVQVRGMMLAGTHDIQGEPQGRGPDVDRALEGRASGQPAILLSHNPVVLDDAIAHDVDLLLSGHTHGGQFYPGVWIVGATTRTLSGYYSFGDTQVFVTNGCRFWGPPARLGAPMDIAVLDLVRA
jgi:predicted MPP superfamily phosphohydrolase